MRIINKKIVAFMTTVITVGSIATGWAGSLPPPTPRPTISMEVVNQVPSTIMVTWSDSSAFANTCTNAMRSGSSCWIYSKGYYDTATFTNWATPSNYCEVRYNKQGIDNINNVGTGFECTQTGNDTMTITGG